MEKTFVEIREIYESRWGEGKHSLHQNISNKFEKISYVTVLISKKTNICYQSSGWHMQGNDFDFKYCYLFY
jgi:hypothetical protein